VPFQNREKDPSNKDCAAVPSQNGGRGLPQMDCGHCLLPGTEDELLWVVDGGRDTVPAWTSGKLSVFRPSLIAGRGVDLCPAAPPP
jgi:hypothetical protein